MPPKQTKARQVNADESDKSRDKSRSLSNEDFTLSHPTNPDDPLPGGDPVEKGRMARDRLIRALANPLEVRLDVELIRDLGVSEEEARSWMDDSSFQAAVDEELGRRCGEARAAVWRALIREALRGSFQHIKLYLELAGDLKPRGNEHEGMGNPVVIIRPDRT